MKRAWPFFILALFPLLALATNIKGILFNCFNSFDFGIYAQGLYEMSAFRSWNPELTVRASTVFGDHVTLASVISFPWIWITGFHPAGLIVWEWLMFMSAFLLVGFWKRSSLFFCFAFMVFAKGLLSGLEFPIHVDYWSLPVWVWLVFAITRENGRHIILSSLVLCLFKESFPFAIMGLSAYYLLRRSWRIALPLLVIASGFILLDYIIRPLVTPVYNHAIHITRNLHELGLIGFLQLMIREFDFIVPLKLFVSFIIPLIWIIRTEMRSWRHPLTAVACLLAPLTALHFLTNKFYFQYAVAFSAPLLALVIFSSFPEKASKKILFLTLGIAILTGSSIYTKMVKFTLFDQTQGRCIATRDKHTHTQELLAIMSSIREQDHILATGGVIPRVLRPGLHIYHAGQNSLLRTRPRYDLLLLERQHSGDIFPMSESDVMALEMRCRPYVTETLIDNADYWLVRGDFPENCPPKL